MLKKLLTAFVSLVSIFSLTTSANAVAVGCTFNNTRTLSLGTTNADVRIAQRILNLSTDTQVATRGSGSPGNESTYFGTATRNAVIKFQAKYGVTVEYGKIGKVTRAKLSSVCTGADTPTAINGMCGTSNGKTLTTAPTSNLCTKGTASTVSGSGPWTWTCAGVYGGTTASCTALKKTAALPTASIYAASSTLAYANTGTTITWSSMNTTSCTTSNGKTGTTGSFTTGALTVATTYSVTCTGTGGSITKSVTVNILPAPVVGTCGTSNGTTVSSIPTTNLCSTGTASTVSGSGPWSWTCAGSNGGATASCSASKTVVVTDTTAPSIPSGFTVTPVSSSQLNLAWTASTDNTAVNGYKVYRGGVQIATTTTTSYSNTGLTSATTYSYTVAAYDAAGNTSSQGTAVTGTTQATVTAVTGTCGTSNGTTVSSIPTTNLCSTGTASTVSGSGPWSWTCAGSNGGATASCSANMTVVSTPTSSVPTVLYTDAVSGPTSGGENNQGAYLSIFGKNFYSGTPSGMGTSVKVYVGGVEVNNYRYMGPSKVNDVLGIQQITVQVGSLGNPTQGTPLPVTVVSNGVTSTGSVTFTPNPGRILFVSLSGNDATAVPGDITKPYRYLQATSSDRVYVATSSVYGAMRSGDHIVIRGGNWSDISTYSTWIRFTTTYSDSVAPTPQASLRGGKAPTGVSGTGWVHITAYPGPINGNAIEDVHYSTPSGMKGGIQGPNSAYRGITGDYISISNLRMDVSGTATSDAAPINSQYANGPWHVVNNDLGPWPMTTTIGYAGGISGSGLKNYKLYGNYIHDIASISTSLTNHGIYIGDGDGGDVAYNHIARITGGNGFQSSDTTNGLPTDNLRVHHNVIHDITKHGINISEGARNNINLYNNLVYNIRQACIRFASNTITNVKVYNNTCHNLNQDRAASNDPHWSGVGAIQNDGWSVTGVQFDVKNNIFNPSTDTPYTGGAGFSGTATFAKNVFYGGYAGDTTVSIDSTKVTSNPLFVSPGADFHLQATSPAIDVGSTAVSSMVTTDLDMISRPQGAGYDIGAYER